MVQNAKCASCPRFEQLCESWGADQAMVFEQTLNADNDRAKIKRYDEDLRSFDAEARLRIIAGLVDMGIDPTEELVDEVDAELNRTSYHQAVKDLNTLTALAGLHSATLAHYERNLQARTEALLACPGPKDVFTVSGFMGRLLLGHAPCSLQD